MKLTAVSPNSCCFFCGYSWCCNANNTRPVSLETMFQQEVTAVDLNSAPNFRLYLSPNEGGALNMRPHLSTDRGLIVSAGTERSFFDLALSGPECEGLVVRDIHPYVKAYVDFNTLLLRIANDREHYIQLSASPEKIEEIRTLMEAEASLPPHMKQYYREHLDAFAKIYFEETENPKYWRDKSAFNGVKYHEDDTLFQRLQQHARAGNIIATVGDIGSLSFLDQRTIATIDISNIPDYRILHIQTKSLPRIITTCPHLAKTAYVSSEYHKLSGTEIGELEGLLRVCRQLLQRYDDNGTFGGGLHDLLRSGNRTFSKVNSCFYSEELLHALREHKNQHWICFRGKWIDFSPQGNGTNWAQGLSESDVREFSLDECIALKPFLPAIQTAIQKRWLIPDRVREELEAIPNRIAKDQAQIST